MMWAAGLTVMGASLEAGPEEAEVTADNVEEDSVSVSVVCLLVDDASLLVVTSGFLNDDVCEVSEALRLDESLGLSVETASDIPGGEISVISTVLSSSPLFLFLILIFLIDLKTGESLPLWEGRGLPLTSGPEDF